MKIIIINSGSITNSYDSIEEYIEFKLDGEDYETGILESAAATAKNNSKAIGRLLNVLAEKEIIDADDVANIVDDYIPGTIKFEKDE